ncbi:hypothetical protein K3495_g12279 [Podosphaera aphanis]|nr:hypothetical protein K3495_g12279 [Podosphaera aphanis]
MNALSMSKNLNETLIYLQSCESNTTSLQVVPSAAANAARGNLGNKGRRRGRQRGSNFKNPRHRNSSRGDDGKNREERGDNSESDECQFCGMKNHSERDYRIKMRYSREARQKSIAKEDADAHFVRVTDYNSNDPNYFSYPLVNLNASRLNTTIIAAERNRNAKATPTTIKYSL